MKDVIHDLCEDLNVLVNKRNRLKNQGVKCNPEDIAKISSLKKAISILEKAENNLTVRVCFEF